jgi:hypothetical protein
MISDLVTDVVKIVDVIEDPKTAAEVAEAKEQRVNTLQNSLEYMGMLETWVI